MPIMPIAYYAHRLLCPSPIIPIKPIPMPNNPITTLPLDRLALHLAANHVPNAAHILQQEEGRRRMANKVPLWAQTPGIEYPPRLALEQCSGQPAAQYKASLDRKSVV